MERLVRIPRQLLHAGLDDLPHPSRTAVLPLLAELPIVPDGAHSALLIGAERETLPCLAVLARHVGQGLRDHNLGLAHDRSRLAAERHKLVFLDSATLARLVENGEGRLVQEAVLFTYSSGPVELPVRALLEDRERAGRASFVAVPSAPPGLAHWRAIALPSAWA